MKHWKTLAGLAALVMILTQCDLGTPPQTAVGGGTEVEGVIVDRTGKPAAGLWVRVYPDSGTVLAKSGAAAESFLAIRDSAKTGANGVFKLSDLPAGTYNLVATVKRNDTILSVFRRSIVVTGSLNLGTDTLRVTGSLLLNVALQGASISGAQCRIPGSPFVALSDLSGLCTLTGIPPGTYRVSVSIPGLPAGQTGDLAVFSLQVTQAGTVNLTWVSSPVDTLAPRDTEWVVRVDSIPTFFIGLATSGFKDSVAFTPLKEVRTYATWSYDGGTLGVGRNLQSPDIDVRARASQTVNVNLRFVNPAAVPTGGSVRVFDARGTLMHSDSATPWSALHRVASRFRRAALLAEFPDSLSSASSPTSHWKLRINRVVVKKNGIVKLDSTRATSFESLRTFAFPVEYMSPSGWDSLEVLVYGTTPGGTSNLLEGWDPAKPIYRAVAVLTPYATTAPDLQYVWVGPTSLPSGCIIPSSLPTLKSPANLATVAAGNVALTWDTICGATAYRVQVSLDSSFTSGTLLDSTVASTGYSFAATAGVTYAWRVSGRTSDAWTAWSAVRRFSTATPVNPPSAPTLIFPGQDSVGVPTSATFTWNAVTGATSYRLQISTDSGLTTLFRNDTLLTTTSRAVTGLANGTRYYWRVVATNSAGSASSVTRRFTTASSAQSGVAAPNLISPSDSAVNVALSPGLSWSSASGATSYQLQISTSNTFSGITRGDSLLTVTSKSGIALTASTVYYWRVRGWSGNNSSTAGPWSTVRQFTTEAASQLPGAPSLVTPINDTTLTSLSPTLSWIGSANASYYRLQVSTDTSFATTVSNDSVTVTSKSVGPLTSGTSYFWRVVAVNSYGTATSERRRFNTKAL